MMKRLLSSLILILLGTPLFAQLISAVPAFPSAGDSVVIYFDASLGNKALKGYTGDVYAHTGVITDKSTSTSDWKYVKTNWGVNTAETKLTKVGNDLYMLKLKPSIRAYYNVPDAEKILKMAFVFRSSDSKLEGKTETGGDIFYEVYEATLSVSIISPSENPFIVNVNSQVNIKLAGNKADSVQLLINNVRKASTTNAELTYAYVPTQKGNYRIKALAWANNVSVVDSADFFAMGTINTADLPSPAFVDGVNYVSESSVTLVLFAPYKNYVFAIGDYSNWEVNENILMNRTPDGNRYWITLSGLEPGKEYAYQFLVDGKLRIADPYAEKILDPWNDKYITSTIYPDLKPYPENKTSGVVSVFQTNKPQYTWKNKNFSPPSPAQMVIYELLVRDFTSNGDLQTVIDTLGYLKRLGINVLELMPVSEFEGNDSWGYNPAFYFATDKAYGPSNKLKELVDSCHSMGIAVILDMVLNHSYGLSPLVQLYFDGSKPTAQNPWYNVTSPNSAYSWGYDFNHQSVETKKFVDRVNKYWLTEFKFDGFRFDFTKGFTNTPGDGWAYDQARIDILKRMNAEIKKVNPAAVVILEHFADNSEEKILAADGMYVWGNITGAYGEGAMGWNENTKSDFSWVSYKARNFTSPRVVGYMESHDEERLMYKALTFGNSNNPAYPISNFIVNSLKRAELSAVFLLTNPGPKMIWQFGELGYDVSIDFNGRVGRKPIKWEYYNQPGRRRLYDIYSALNHLKTNYAPMATENFTTNYTGLVKSITLNHADFDVVVFGNYNVYPEEPQITFPKTGWWYNYMSGDSIQITNLNTKFVLNPSDYKIFTSKKITKPVVITSILGDGNKKSNLPMSAYPNPFTNELTLSIESDSYQAANFRIYSITGELVHDEIIQLNSGNNEIRWNSDSSYSGNLEGGIYICVVHTPTSSYISKLIKK